MPTRRFLLKGLLGGAGLLATPAIAPARTPEARAALLDAQMRQMVEGRSTPGIVALVL